MSLTIFQSEKTAFYPIKTRSSKSQYLEKFPKGLTHSFGPKMASFSIFLFQVLQARKMSFTIFQSDTTPFYAIKTRTSKSRKIEIFPKGLTYGFGPKMSSFPTFFFQAIQARKISFRIFQSEKTSFQATKKRSKSQEIDIFPKGLTLGFGPKIAIFSTFFFQALWARKIFFTIFQTKKTPIQAIKTRSSKSSNIDIFPMGLTHGFGPKMVIFPTFFFQAIQARKMSFPIFQSETMSFQAIKTRNSKSRKTKFFPKGLTHGFGPKMTIFRNFFSSAIQARKMSFTIFQSKKTSFQATKTRSSKSRKIDIFPKELTHGFSRNIIFFPTFFFQAIQAKKMSFTIFQSEKTPFQAIKTRG